MGEIKKEVIRASGHFVICDAQVEYSESLFRVLTEKYQEQYQFHIFHDTEKLIKFSEKTEILILMIGEEYPEEERNTIKAEKKLIFTEDRQISEEEQERYVFRYQSADKLMEAARTPYRISEKRKVHAKRRKEEERYERPRIRAEPEIKGLIGVYSPIHRIGKTKFALKLGVQLSSGMNVLYLNMEGYSGGNYYFPEDTGQNLGDLLYFMRQEKMNQGLKLSTMAGQTGSMDYIAPMENEHDLRGVKKEEWIDLIDMIFRKCIYEVVILDLGDSINGLYDLLKKCDRVYTPYIEEGAAKAKLDQYERNLRAAGYEEVLDHTVKKRMGRPRQIDERSVNAG